MDDHEHPAESSMSPMSTFPGETVISSFSHVELMFDDVLRHIPYVSEHENVWSPRLVTVLMEACSQLDSLWKYKVTNSPNAILPPSSKNLNITHYFQNFGQELVPQWAVLWARGKADGAVYCVGKSVLCTTVLCTFGLVAGIQRREA